MYTWKIAIDVAKTSHMTSWQVLWLIYSFHTEFIYYWWLFNNNNIFLDKAYDLSTYLINTDWLNNIVNHDKCRDPMQQSP